MEEIEKLRALLPDMARFEAQVNALRAVLETQYAEDFQTGDYPVETATRVLLKLRDRETWAIDCSRCHRKVRDAPLCVVCETDQRNKIEQRKPEGD